MNAAMHTSREPPLAARERKHLPMAENPGRPLEQQRSQRSKSPQITPHLSNAIAQSPTDPTKRARNNPAEGNDACGLGAARGAALADGRTPGVAVILPQAGRSRSLKRIPAPATPA
jgi:hypothetical protein